MTTNIKGINELQLKSKTCYLKWMVINFILFVTIKYFTIPASRVSIQYNFSNLFSCTFRKIILSKYCKFVSTSLIDPDVIILKLWCVFSSLGIFNHYMLRKLDFSCQMLNPITLLPNRMRKCRNRLNKHHDFFFQQFIKKIRRFPCWKSIRQLYI